MRLPSAKTVLILLAAFALAGCQSAPPRPTFPDLRFTAEPPIRLDVAVVDFRDDYKPPFRAPNVEQLFPVPPARAAENWAHDRLQAVGASGRAVFVLRRASVTETDLPQTQGITGVFTTEPSQRYDMALSAALQIIDAQGRTVRTVSVESTRTQSVLNDITPNQRDRIWYDMTKALMSDFDAKMASEIAGSLGPYYVR